MLSILLIFIALGASGRIHDNLFSSLVTNGPDKSESLSLGCFSFQVYNTSFVEMLVTNKRSVVNTDSGAVFATLHFLCNLRPNMLGHLSLASLSNQV